MKKVLAVCDTEIGYGEKLCAMLRREKELPFTPVWFPSKEELTSYSNSKEEIGLLLIDREIMDEEVRKVPAKRIVYLSDVKGYGKIENRKSLYKYQPSSQMLGEILNAYKTQPEEWEGMDYGAPKVNFMAVATPVGNSQKTGFALTMGQLLAKQQRVLYVNLEPFSPLSQMLGMEFPHDLSDFLYCAMEQERDMSLKDMVMEFHGMFFIPPVKNPEDIMHMDYGVLDQMLKKLMEEGHYDVVLMEFDQNFSGFERFLHRCNRVYVPTKNDPLSQEQLRYFRQWLEQKRKSPEAWTKEVQLPYFQYLGTGECYGEQLLWSELGDSVRQLLRGM